MKNENLKIGLALSGGGVRAAVFHLGILSKMADENILENVTMTSTVSGGSLVTGLIYQANGNKWPNSVEFKENCVPYIKNCFTKRNLQLNAIMRLLFWPWPYIQKGRASVFSGGIRYCWKIKSKLNDIPDFPRWNINATSIQSGKSWRFIPNNRMGDYILNYAEKPDIPLSEVLCSSAAVPLLIGPYKLVTKNYEWFKYEGEKKVKISPKYNKLHIWDGGAYDNLGLEPLLKFNKGIQYRDEFNFLIVSDAALEIETRKRNAVRPIRLIDVTMDQVRALRARTVWDHFQINKNAGLYLKIGEFSANGLSKEKVRKLKSYPTTLWKINSEDFNDLFTHGREVMSKALEADTNI